MLKQLCLLVTGASLALLQGDVLHWQTHRLSELICLKSPLNCKGESVSLFCLIDLPCFVWGVSLVSVLLYCMFAKEAERERTK